jgi:hypothetical protein
LRGLRAVALADMMRYLRRHSLTIQNTNSVDIQGFAVRFQLPESVFGNLVIEDSPAGVEVTWHACRLSFNLVGDGASATTGQGGTRIATGAVAGSSAVAYANREICSVAIDNKNFHPTGIYQLRVAKLPASTTIRLAFVTSNDPESQGYIERHDSRGSNSLLSYFGDGRWQYSSDHHVETQPIFVALRFDANKRTLTSEPSSSETGKWKLNLIQTN